jgi:hypothetical protein
MSIVRKTLVAGLAGLTLAAGVAGSAAPAAAWYNGGWGAPVAAGVLGGLAAGAIIGSATHPYGYGPGYYGYAPEPVYNPCYRERRPVYDANGYFAGYRVVRVCN